MSQDPGDEHHDSQISIYRDFMARGTGEAQLRIMRGDEDGRLDELDEAFEAFFALSRKKLGHDHVPIGIWETAQMIKHRMIKRRNICQ